MNEKTKVNFFSLGIVRGLIGFVVGFVIGLLLVEGIRLLVGLPAFQPLQPPNNYLFSQGAWVAGAVLGAVGFMLRSGTVDDWFRWMRGLPTPEHPHDAFPSGAARYLSASFDHKVIGIQYGAATLINLLIAGLFALIFRTELVQPGIEFLPLGSYNTLMSLHGILMVYTMIIGVAAMSNYLVPLMIGANDMAFPRLNAFAFWLNVPATLILLSSMVLGGFDTGWTGYPPLSTRAPLGMDMFFVGVYLFGLSSIIGALNIIASIIRLRASGMSYFRMPIFVWSAFATAIIGLNATQLIGLAFQLVLFERIFGMGFFEPSMGGDPILFQHLFWFYSHPAVYLFILTGLGVISELLPVFSRKPLYGYRWVAISSFGIAMVGFLVWAHHMFTSGMAPYLRIPFMYSTLLVAVPTGVKFFSWIATIWEGKLSFETPMLFVLGAISIFLLGGLSGPPHGTVSTDLHLHDTYFVVGHFHATMFGGFIFPFFAAIYYWFPKMTGRMYNETLGKIHFYIMLPSFYVQSVGQMLVGLLGMRRRIGDYEPMYGIDTVHLWITIAAFLIGIAVLVGIANLIYSAARGPVASANPWRSRSPEFMLPSPVPVVNYPEPIHVIGEPYDYGLEGSAYVDIDPERAPKASRPPRTGELGVAPSGAD